MSKGDFTRFTFRPQKHYRQINNQQGRVGLDADWNEQAEITAYRSETEALDFVGPAGAPKHYPGFGVSVAGVPSGDFKIGEGRFYVDGILCENDAEILFTQQPDLPGAKALTAAGRYVVYLDVWQRHLTALDDPEIREVALGGPDTATRTKTVWQVKVAGNLGANVTCASQPPPWKNASTGKLSARAQPDAQSDKPCIVPPGAGYRRLENQLYRVEIHHEGSLAGQDATFKWSRENGSITAGMGSIAGNTITLTTSRKDSALGFAPGDWIEIIDAGNELRGETGTLVRITTVDDLVLTVDPTTVIGTLPSTLDLALHPKVRRWDSVGAVAVSLPSTNDGFIPLEDGVEVKFEAGSYYTGDYWMIPARTALGNVEWPQVPGSSPSVPEAQRPLGIQHHFCRLAIIDVAANGAVTLSEDCRRLFPPLTELEDACGCCTKTVGETDAADYRLIQDAVDSLPDSGGQICVLAGTYAESVEIAGKHNITIIGCGERSLLTSGPSKAGVIGPIIQIKDSSNIRVENLLFIEGEHSAIRVLSSTYVTIADCKILMVRSNSPEPAIFFQADDGLIERNFISVFELTFFTSALFRLPAAAAPPASGSTQLAGSGHPASGIQLAGGCHRVRVVENVITNVKGQGVTFGHLEEAPLSVSSPATATTPNLATTRMIFGGWKNPDDQCADCKPITNEVPSHPSQATPQPTHEIISPLSLWDIYIERNRIQSAGLDGIGVIGFFDLTKVDEFVRVRRLTILGNEITDCLALPHKQIPANWVDQMGYGGIALADVSELVIQDNVIERNGAKYDQPACGIFVLHGDGIDIERNRILDNGYQRQQTALPSATVSLGRQGGIHVVYALAPAAPFIGFSPMLNIDFPAIRAARESTGFPALKVHDNIVSAPVGQALWATALGPVSVVGNQLTTGHVNRTKDPFVFAPATVFIFNLGVSNEEYRQILFAAFASSTPAPSLGFDDQRVGQRLANGNVLFADNQCSLDLLEPGSSGILLTSILLLSLDDVGFLDNQCDCNLGMREDFVVAHTLLLGASVRMIGNRLKEGSLNAMFSGITYGHLNTLANNQATHCLMAATDPGGQKLDAGNMIRFPTFCRPNIRNTAVAFTETKAQASS
jgi:hypothetical protein